MDLMLIVYLIINLHGMFMIGSYFMSMPILNSLYIFDNEHVFQDDAPGVFAIIELCFALASIIIFNVSYYIRDREDYTPLKTEESQAKIRFIGKQTSRVLVGFYAAFFAGSLTFAIMRMSSMGLFYHLNLSPNNAETCADIEWQTGCPTTRFNKYKKNKITEKSECMFNAYNQDSIETNGTTLIDWSMKKNYDATKRSELVQRVNQKLNIACVDNKCQLGSCDANDKCVVSDDDLPKIHWCWYWGCDPVCNERYTVNQAWLTFSWINAIFYLTIMTLMIISIC